MNDTSLDTQYELYYWCTPNGDKALIMMEELGLAYELKPINILKGDQYDESFLSVSPNNKIPAIRASMPSGEKVTLFESGAILLDLADRYGRLLDPQKRSETLQWLFWQIGGLGPMAGQTHHFNFYAPETIPYAKERYKKETKRLYTVLEKQLQGRKYIVDEFSIADIACYPWIECYELQEISLDTFPNIQNWLFRIRERESVKKAKMINQRFSKPNQFDESARKHMFK